MLRKLSPAVIACALALTAGCGGDGDDETSAKDPATTDGQRATANLERFLLGRGEEPGYQPGGGVRTVSNENELVGPEGRTRADARRLRDRGFVSLTSRQLDGREGIGITSVLLFTSAAGAKSEATEQRRDLEVDFRGWKVKRFDVPGVPGAFGWTATQPGQRVGNVTWAEGRCVMTLGNADAKSFVAPLTAGVQAVHRRVAGRCP